MRLIGLCSVALFLTLPMISGMAQASGAPARVTEVEKAIAAVRSGKTVDARTNAAEHLASLTKKVSAKEATEKLVIDVMSLLDSSDDSVRYWVARALGNLGPPAKAAIPKLEEMLPKADCINGAITSASGIRYALIQMGVKPPPPQKCPKIAG
jgi:PBS lyase HEAT-like repeat